MSDLRPVTPEVAGSNPVGPAYPERFDPDRFSPERAEDKRHEHAFVPQGAGPVTAHRCPGFDLATFMMAVFAATLLHGYTWELFVGTAGFFSDCSPGCGSSSSMNA